MASRFLAFLLIPFAALGACAPDMWVENFEALVGCYTDDRDQLILQIRANHQVIDSAGRPVATAALDRTDHTTWLELRPGLKWSMQRRALIPTGSKSETHFAMRIALQTTIGLIPVEEEPPLLLVRSSRSC